MSVAGADVEIVVFDALAGGSRVQPRYRSGAAQWSRRFGRWCSRPTALLIATPEYAHGLPGSLKNLLDWLVGSGELYGKRVVVAQRGAERRARHDTRVPISNARCGRKARRCSRRRRSRSVEHSRPGGRRSADSRRGVRWAALAAFDVDDPNAAPGCSVAGGSLGDNCGRKRHLFTIGVRSTGRTMAAPSVAATQTVRWLVHRLGLRGRRSHPRSRSRLGTRCRPRGVALRRRGY